MAQLQALPSRRIRNSSSRCRAFGGPPAAGRCAVRVDAAGAAHAAVRRLPGQGSALRLPDRRHRGGQRGPAAHAVLRLFPNRDRPPSPGGRAAGSRLERRSGGAAARGYAQRAVAPPSPGADCRPPRAGTVVACRGRSLDRPTPARRLLRSAEGLCRAGSGEVERAAGRAPAHGVAALQLQEVDVVGERALRHLRGDRGRHIEAQRQVEAGAERADGDRRGAAVGGVGLLDLSRWWQSRADRPGRARRRSRASARGPRRPRAGTRGRRRSTRPRAAPVPTATTRPPRSPSCGRDSRCRRARASRRRRRAIPRARPT